MDDLLKRVLPYITNVTLWSEIKQRLDTGGWIPVAEQRPDTQRNVEVTDGERRCYGNCCKGHLWNYDDPEMQLATHWRELPALPRGE